jgi:hypothetical protein
MVSRGQEEIAMTLKKLSHEWYALSELLDMDLVLYPYSFSGQCRESTNTALTKHNNTPSIFKLFDFYATLDHSSYLKY